MHRNLTRITGYFEQTVSRYLPVEFKVVQTTLLDKEKNIRKSFLQ